MVTALAAFAACSSDNSNNGGSTSSSNTTTSNNSSSSSSSSKASSSGSSSSASSSSSSSSSSAGVSDGGTDGGDGGTNPDASVTFSQVYTDIIAGHCAGCHHPGDGGAGTAGGGFSLGALDMSSVDAGYMNLVGVPAGGTGLPGFEDAGQKVCHDVGVDAGLLRVAPGDAGGSLLCNKVNPSDTPPTSPPCGDPMPLLSFPLDGGGGGPTQQAVFNEIKTWINQCAKP